MNLQNNVVPVVPAFDGQRALSGMLEKPQSSRQAD
jgi:hypothetical protein